MFLNYSAQITRPIQLTELIVSKETWVESSIISETKIGFVFKNVGVPYISNRNESVKQKLNIYKRNSESAIY